MGDALVAALDQHPEGGRPARDLEPVPETRGLGWLRWDDESEQVGRRYELKRPYMDIAYW